MPKRPPKTASKRSAANQAELPLSDPPVGDYRHAAKRKNNPPAKIAAEGTVPAVPRAQYAYNPHLPPVLRFDQSGSPDRLPALLEKARRGPLTDDEARLLADALRRQDPWLEWTGKREAKSFEVDPVALHIHERISTQAILKVAARQDVQRSLFADPQQEYHEAVQFYRHDVDWANRLILGDSLAVMSSLARREDLAGKVQMIYLDPPYGIKFASNFQPEVGRRDVKDKEQDLTREPEMVRAYRDTWHLGIHSYLSYLRDRLIVARELLADTGSIFVQIGDENVGVVRQLLDEVFGRDNLVAQVNFKSMGALGQADIPKTFDYLLWFSRERSKLKFRPLFREQSFADDPEYRFFDDVNRERVYRRSTLTSSGFTKSCTFDFESHGRTFQPFSGKSWRTNADGMMRLSNADRIFVLGGNIYFKRFAGDFSVMPYDNSWTDPPTAFVRDYVVQTPTKFVERCMLMTTDPGDLVLDPTCGSGTTAYVAEQWGRRWITTDTSRVAIAIARQRLLTAKFDHYKTRHDGAAARTHEGEPGSGADSADLRSGAATEHGGASMRRDVASTQRSAAGTEQRGASTEERAASMRRGVSSTQQSGAGTQMSAAGTQMCAAGTQNGGAGAQDRAADRLRPDNPALGFHYKTVPHITLKSIAQNTALDPIFARHEPRLTAALERANAALTGVTPEIRAKLAAKLARKEREEGKRAVTDADRRRWELPAAGPKGQKDGGAKGFEHWTVPFDTDADWPRELQEAVTAYRAAWRAKMDEVNACIAASAEQEELVDQPEVVRGIVRVSGPFTVEAVQPPEMTLGDNVDPHTGGEGLFAGDPDALPEGFEPRTLRVVEPRPELDTRNVSAYLDQMFRYLKADGVRFLNNKQMRWTRLEPLFEAGTAAAAAGFHAEGRWTPVGDDDPDPDGGSNVGVAFGPQYGPVTVKMIEELIKPAGRRYDHLVIAGFNFTAEAHQMQQENVHPKLKLHFAHIRPDINPAMNGLLKESPQAGAGQLFTVFGLPRVEVRSVQTPEGKTEYVVTMEGVDIYNPVDNSIASTGASKVAAWFLDGDYDGRTFCITQAFFPDRSAWEKLARALNGKDGPIDADRFEAFGGTTSLPFPAGKHRCVAVKVIDPRGNEVMCVERL